ncbi:MAG: hypothetical protein KJ685_07610 [Nanoarchaeota archaeon]|nr:hypothetical protein [Nanoarchaeota archaeon]
MMKLDRKHIEDVLHMYEPEAIYLGEVEIILPKMTAQLWFPPKPIYLVEGTGIKHINNTEVELITNQSLFIFYRQVLTEGSLKFPKIHQDRLREYYNTMFIKKEIDYYEKFTDRNKTDLKINFKHKNSRQIGRAYFVWCDLLIPGFLKAEVVAGIELDSSWQS